MEKANNDLEQHLLLIMVGNNTGWFMSRTVCVWPPTSSNNNVFFWQTAHQKIVFHQPSSEFRLYRNITNKFMLNLDTGCWDLLYELFSYFLWNWKRIIVKGCMYKEQTFRCSTSSSVLSNKICIRYNIKVYYTFHNNKWNPCTKRYHLKIPFSTTVSGCLWYNGITITSVDSIIMLFQHSY